MAMPVSQNHREKFQAFPQTFSNGELKKSIVKSDKAITGMVIVQKNILFFTAKNRKKKPQPTLAPIKFIRRYSFLRSKLTTIPPTTQPSNRAKPRRKVMSFNSFSVSLFFILNSFLFFIKADSLPATYQVILSCLFLRQFHQLRTSCWEVPHESDGFIISQTAV